MQYASPAVKNSTSFVNEDLLIFAITLKTNRLINKF